MTTFRDYYFGLSMDARAEYAERAGTTTAFLQRISYGKPVELGLADVLVALSGGAVSHDDVPLTENAQRQRAIREGAPPPRRRKPARATAAA
jgi:hypothetical protein